MEERGLFLLKNFLHHGLLAPHEYIVQPLLPLHNGAQLFRQRLVNGIHFLEFIEHHDETILSRRHLL